MPQYTNSALEQELKKPERLPVGWPWRLLVFVVIIFGITVATYLGMTLGYKPYLNSRIKNLDNQITDLTKQIDVTQQKNLINFYSQLVNIKNMLDFHPAVSKLFDFLEKNTYQQVYYLYFNFSLAEKTVKIEGIAPNYDVLVKQLELFRRAPQIEKILLEDSKASEEGGVHFSIRLVFKPELVK